jgi:uncharacterized circularly permuted ATP-grasp superfamily protein/uncharacterized alpha-E superfamily protein
VTTATTAHATGGGQGYPGGGHGSPGDGTALAAYTPAAGRSDEYLGPDGQIRTGWKRVAAEFAALGRQGLADRRSELARLLRNEGATYNITEADRWRRQPWLLDPCPLVLEEQEWSVLDRAVTQRVSLLDEVLRDIYGRQRLVASGLVPAEIVLGHPAFLRPCVGLGAPEGRGLFLTALDVVRDPDGCFRSIGDRTQAPSGLGYALVNRTILSRVLPALHRESGVERLAAFFRSVRAGVASAAPEGVDDPRVVILTPGPLSETYFEHAYLASYLGYSLVEGRDLVVENNRVWVRSLSGIDPVDVVIRRVDDQWCDPVELRADSLLGVPGILEVARRGRVAVINPIGTGILEDPALAGLLESLAPKVLGEDLMLRGPATWWCGRPKELSHVLAGLGDLIVTRVGSTGGRRPLVGSALSTAELADLRARIRARPSQWLGQEIIEPSTVPTLTETGWLEPRPAVLRTFSVRTGQDDDGTSGNGGGHHFAVLPGGLTRVGDSPDSLIVSSRGGGPSKDTWVTSAAPALQQSTWLRSPRTTIRDPGASTADAPLPGRVAAQLFVLGRAAEHAELVIRLIRTVLSRLDQPLSLGADSGAQSLQVLLAALGSVSGFDPVTEPEVAGHGGAEPGQAQGMTFDVPTDRRALTLLLDARVDGSLVASLSLLVDAAYSVREQLSGDTWQLVGDLEEELARLRNRPPTQLVALQSNLQRLLQGLLALSGLSAENMERDAVWLFLDAGRRLERAQSLVRLVRALLVRRRAAVVEDLLLESLLKTSESLMIFRRRSGPVMRVAGAVDLLVYDSANPRSVVYQLDRLFDHLAQLPDRSPSAGSRLDEQLLRRMATILQQTDAQRLAAVDPEGDQRSTLDTVLGEVDGLLGELLDNLRATFFMHERLSILAGGQPDALE